MMPKNYRMCNQNSLVKTNGRLYIRYYNGHAVVTGVKLNTFGHLIWSTVNERQLSQKN
jgi:hypothetical protein